MTPSDWDRAVVVVCFVLAVVLFILLQENSMEGINNAVTLKDAAQIIAATGDHTTTILVGEPGVGRRDTPNDYQVLIGTHSIRPSNP